MPDSLRPHGQEHWLLLLLSHFSRVRLCATPQTATHQALPSLGFSRQEHRSGLPFPSPKNTGVSSYFLLQGIFLTQGLNLCLLRLLHWQMDSLLLCHLGRPLVTGKKQIKATIYYRTPVRMAITKKTKNKCCWACEGKETLICCWWACKLVQPLFLKTVWKFL